MSNKFNPRDIKYGLMVIDPNQKGEMVDILHFVGYWEPPTAIDSVNLRKELGEDENFGLSDIIDRLVILPAPAYIVEKYVNEIISNEEKEKVKQ